jgi:ankyrin repeat protein
MIHNYILAALRMLLESFKDVTVDVQQGEGSNAPLLSQLAMQRDSDGSTPLHLAASWLDRWLQWQVLPGRFPELLLDANICSAYQQDNEGLYPMHSCCCLG